MQQENTNNYAAEAPDEELCESMFEPVKVLDHGFVRLVDWIGDDDRIAESARVSYQAGTTQVRNNAGLVDYLTRMHHSSPIEQVSLVFHLKLPLFVAAQFLRHRTAKVNVVSYRYSEAPDEFYIPEKARGQARNNKQVSVEDARLNSHKMQSIMQEVTRISHLAYTSMRDDGIARELARIILPQNLYTEIYWKQDLHNLLHFLRLRDDSAAQWEAQKYAEVMYRSAKLIAPAAVASWENHTKNAVKLSSDEVGMLQEVLTDEVLAQLTELAEGKLKGGLRREAVEKFRKLAGR